MAAPGAPLIGSAAPENTPPNPSPIHQTPKDHTTDTARAVLVLRLQATPSPIPTWIRAKTALIATGWCPMVRPDHRMDRAMSGGFPSADMVIMWAPNERVKK